MTDELIEKVARIINPELWDDVLPVPTRSDTILFHERWLKSALIARAVLAYLREQGLLSEWWSIETAQNDETILLAYDDGSVRLIRAINNDFEWQPYQGSRGPGVVSPTHWMPPCAAGRRGEMTGDRERACACISYNQPQPWQTVPERVLKCPEWAMALFQNARATICVDSCIADSVLALWGARIWTYGSCCGHGDPAKRAVIVDRGDRGRARRVLDRVDETVRVGAWELVFDGEVPA